MSRARNLLHDAHFIAQNGGRVRLLAEIATLLANLPDDLPLQPHRAVCRAYADAYWDAGFDTYTRVYGVYTGVYMR